MEHAQSTTTTAARAVRYSEFGGPEVLRMVELPVPTAGTGELVVAVRAAGVNPIDWKIRKAIRPSGPISTPRGLGSDAAGVIVDIGDEVSGWRLGDEVLVHGATACYSSHVVVGPERILPKPRTLDWEQAAALGIPASTAYQALRSLDVGRGSTLLVHGGAGAVGQAAAQLAREWGATVVTTASEPNHARLRELGAIPVSYGPGLVERIRTAAPQGIDRVLDAAGTEEAIDASLELVQDRRSIGTIVLGARAAELGIQAWAGGNPVPLTIEEQRLRREAIPEVAALIAAGRFEVEIAGRYPLEAAAAAHRESESGHVRGKIVLIP